jgi:glycosyltransferase involved in cell wall biosynthesis
MATNHIGRPLVSVCVPTYNNAAYLLQSLESILNQTYKHLEIVVGDDGSTDNTGDLVQSIKDPRIRYHRNDTNLGQFRNVNCLIRQARGEYIAIYHSDDIYEPRIVDREVSFLETHPEAGAVFALDRWIDVNGRLYGETKLPKGVQTNTCLGLEEVMPILLCNKNRLLRAPTFMGRAKVFSEVGPFSQKFDIQGDFEMWLRILTKFKIGILGEYLMRYRSGGAQQVSTFDKYFRTQEEQFFPIMDLYLDTNGMALKADSKPMVEYAFHRCDDETSRAANFVVRGEVANAIKLLRRPFPWRTLITSIRRRKLRVLMIRTLIRTALAVGVVRPLVKLLRWIE